MLIITIFLNLYPQTSPKNDRERRDSLTKVRKYLQIISQCQKIFQSMFCEFSDAAEFIKMTLKDFFSLKLLACFVSPHVGKVPAGWHVAPHK